MRTAHLLVAVLMMAATPLRAGEITLSVPPDSIARWYKPQNERHVFLHTMFGLRRAMQAVGLYAALEDQDRMQQWAERLVSGYRKIPEMVPEWRDEVDLKWADRLLEATGAGDVSEVTSAVRELTTTCRSCHNEYQAVTAAIYRYPSFEEVTVEDPMTLEEVAYPDLMEGLSTSLNRVIIGVKDGQWNRANTALGKLKERLELAGNSCGQCHDDDAPRERIVGGGMGAELVGLAAAIDAKDGETAGEHLGGIGVAVCARCHGIHRIPAALRHQITSAGAPPVE